MIGHYLLVAFRGFRKRKIATAIKILALSLGLSCFLGAYIVAYYFDHTDSQWKNSDRIVTFREQIVVPSSDAKFPALPLTSPVLAKYLKADFPQLVATGRHTSVAGSREIPVQAGDHKSFRIVKASDPGFFKIFDFNLLKGNPQTALSSPKSAIITTKAARGIFGTTDVMGRTIRIEDLVDVTITGVMDEIPPPSHLGRTYAGNHFDLLVSMDVFDDLSNPASIGTDRDRPSEMESWTYINFISYALLPADGSFTIDDLNKQLPAFVARHVPKGPFTIKLDAIPVTDLSAVWIDSYVLGDSFGVSITTILYLFGALVLGVACLDFANLATAEASRRAKEVGMRKVMGAMRHQLALQNLIEVGLLAAVSLVLALGVMGVVASAINSPVDLGMRLPSITRVDFWATILGVLVATSLAAGGYPALVLSRIRPIFALRVGRVRGGSRIVRAILTGAQFAAASILLIGVVVIYNENSVLQKTGLGLTDDPLIILPTRLIDAKINPDTFRSAVLATKGVTGYTASQTLPFDRTISGSEFSSSPSTTERKVTTSIRQVSFDFFKISGAKLLAGRDFSKERGDDISRNPLGANPDLSQPDQLQSTIDSAPTPRIILDQSAAETFGWSPAQAVGKLVYQKRPISTPSGPRDIVFPYEVIGVVDKAPMELTSSTSKDFVYEVDSGSGYAIIKISKSDISGTLARIKDLWEQMAPSVAFRSRFLDEQFEMSYHLFGVLNRAFLGVAIFAIIIASLGLIGMATFIVGRRVQEIGVRKTLGASTWQVLRMLLWDFSKPVVIANIIAWPLAFVIVQIYLSVFITRIPLTPLPFVVSFIVTVAIAWGAVANQAIRAARLNPATVLKYE